MSFGSARMTRRHLNPTADRLRESITAALAAANGQARARTIVEPRGLIEQILGSRQGLVQLDGGGRTARTWDRADTPSLVVAWWTAVGKARDKFVLVDGRRVDADESTADSAAGVPPLRIRPAEAIRGYRTPRGGGLVGSFPEDFCDLNRMPALDPDREALTLAGLYGDETARAALGDLELERGGPPGRR